MYSPGNLNPNCPHPLHHLSCSVPHQNKSPLQICMEVMTFRNMIRPPMENPPAFSLQQGKSSAVREPSIFRPRKIQYIMSLLSHIEQKHDFHDSIRPFFLLSTFFSPLRTHPCGNPKSNRKKEPVNSALRRDALLFRELYKLCFAASPAILSKLSSSHAPSPAESTAL